MADKQINELTAATAVTAGDLFVLQQNNTAKKLTAQILENWLVALADGHGGIQSIAKTSSSGLVDTYTISLADLTTTTFTVTNGKTISSVTTYYAVSSDGSTAPSSWSTTRQSMTSTNRYLWSYQTIAFNDSSTIDTVKTVIGVWGDKGDTGAAGRGITDLEQTSRVPGSYTLYTFTMSDGTTETFYSYDGVGISGIEKTSTSGLVDTYTISYTNNTTTEFTVTNAKSIVSIAKTSTVGLVDTYTILFNDETSTTFTVSNAKSISSISKTSTSGLVDTYTVSFNDGSTTAFNVTNGSSISTIAKTSSVGLVDTYTVTLTSGAISTFTVKNAKSIVNVAMVSGTHAAGTTDTYRITFNDGDTTDFAVYNGTNGTGSVSTVDGIPAVSQNVTLLLTGNGPPTESTVGQFKQRYFDLSNQILYICVGIDTTSTPTTYSWAGAGVPVDSSLSSMSENPVQNKVITAKVGTSALTTTATDLSGAVNELKSDVDALDSGKAASDLGITNASAGDLVGISTVSSGKPSAFKNVPINAVKCNNNLLINGYFVKGEGTTGDYGVFPVNQRGQASYSSADYTIDGWKRTAGQTGSKCEVLSTGIHLTNASALGGNFRFAQDGIKVEALGGIGSTLTASVFVVSISGTARQQINFYDSGGSFISPSYEVVLDGVGVFSKTFTVPSGAATMLYMINNVANAALDVTIGAAKLEPGDTQTLAHYDGSNWILNEIPDYEEQLIRCKTSRADSSDTYANGSVEFGNNIGIVQNTDTATQNITEGQYVIWHGALYTASSAITSGTTLSASNLTAVSSGGFNALNSLIAAFVPSKSVTMPSSAASFSLNIPNNARFLMCASDSSLNRCALFHVISFASGTVFAKEIGTSNFTFDTSNINRLKVTMSSSGQVALSVWAISGSEASLNSVYFVT